MKKTIWAVIVAYKPTNVTTLISAITPHNYIVIDNTNNNRGYAAGANKGIRKALGEGATWIVILNQDIEIDKEGYKDFCRRLLKTKPGIAGPFAGSLDKKRWTTLLPAVEGIDYISGACMAIHRQVIKTVGEFYEPYFMYYEDVDLSTRAKRAGFPLVHVPIEIHHRDKSNPYYLARNHLLFVERNAPRKVKFRELVRLIKTFYEHRKSGDGEGELGVYHYMMRRFGNRDI